MGEARGRQASRSRPSGIAVGGAAVVLLLGSVVAVVAQENTTSPSNFTNESASIPAVYGYITDPGGKRIEGAKVEVFLNSAYRQDYAITDNNGFFIIMLYKPNDFYELQASADGFLFSSTRVSVYRRERVDFTLQPDPRPREEFAPESRTRVKARRTMQDGLELASTGKRAEAIALLREAVQIDPEYAAAFNNLAVNLRLTGDLSGAEEALRTAVDLRPLDYHANFNLGALLYDTGRFHEAAPTLETAVLADPTSAMAEAMLGRSYLALRLAGRALQHLEEGQRLGSPELDLSLEISDAYVISGDLGKALRAKEKWLAAHASDPRAVRVAETVETIEGKIAAAKN